MSSANTIFFFKSQLLFIYSVFFNVLASLSHCSLPPLCFLFISSELFKFQVTSFIWHWHLLLLTRDGHVGNTLVVLSLWVCLHSLLIRHHDKLLFLIKMFELWTVENCFAALPKVLLFAAFLLLLSFWYVTLLIVRIFFFFCWLAVFATKTLLIASTHSCFSPLRNLCCYFFLIYLSVDCSSLKFRFPPYNCSFELLLARLQFRLLYY